MTNALFAAVVWKVVDFLRMLANAKNEVSGIVTQMCAWTGAILIVAVGAHAALVQNVVLPGTDLALGKLDGWSQALAGLLVGSLGSAVVDLKQAIDNTDTSRLPRLIGRRSPQ